MPGTPVRSDFSRAFLLEGRAGPAVTPVYEGFWRPGAPTWAQGDATTMRAPSPTQYGQFINIGKIIGAPGDPQLSITARYTFDADDLLRIARSGCDNDLQIHMGQCQSPQDFNGGWDKILVLEAARITQWATNELGAMQPGDRAFVDETIPWTGQDLYEITKQTYARMAATQITQEAVDVTVCDAVTCAACGIASDGCQVVFGLVLRAGASPGQGANVIYTSNGGATWGYRNITAFTASNDPDRFTCVGTNLVIVSIELAGLTYAPIKDILAGTETWTTVLTGFVGAGAPKAIWSASPTATYIVGNGGYIYKTTDPTAGVTVQDAGVATSQNLNDVHGIDEQHVVAVGAANAVVYTANGGRTWQSITGPAVGVALNTVSMRSATEWFVGTAGGKLFYTRDSGVTWTEKAFSGSGSGAVTHVKFANLTVGYMTHNTATVGRIFRTIDGGNSWYLAPEAPALLPSVKQFDRVATCANVNVTYVSGLATGSVDGDMVKGT